MEAIDKKYNLIAKYDKLCADVWKDKQYYLSHEDIAEYRGIKVSQSKYLLQQAKYILKHQDEMWTWGLSNRAKFALLKQGYRSLAQLKRDLDKVDLQSFEGVGETVAEEICRWAAKTT